MLMKVSPRRIKNTVFKPTRGISFIGHIFAAVSNSSLYRCMCSYLNVLEPIYVICNTARS